MDERSSRGANKSITQSNLCYFAICYFAFILHSWASGENEKMNELSNQRTDRWINESTNKWMNESINQSRLSGFAFVLLPGAICKEFFRRRFQFFWFFPRTLLRRRVVEVTSTIRGFVFRPTKDDRLQFTQMTITMMTDDSLHRC